MKWIYILVSQGDPSAYEQLTRKFTMSFALKETALAQELQLLIHALSHVVSQLDRRCSTLVSAIINLQWAAADSAFVKSYIAFIGLLLSAQSQYGIAVLERAVEGLTHREFERVQLALVSSHSEPLAVESDISALNMTNEGSGSSKRLTRGDLYDRYHSLLSNVLSIVPTLAKSLHPILSRRFPHKRLEKIYHVTYTRNVLRIASYCPGLSDQILGSVIEQAIQIDVGFLSTPLSDAR